MKKFKVEIRGSECNTLIATLGVFESIEVAEMEIDFYFSQNDCEDLEAKILTVKL